MGIESLKIKNIYNYDFDGAVYLHDFDVKLVKTLKRESRIGANIYCIGYLIEMNMIT